MHSNTNSAERANVRVAVLRRTCRGARRDQLGTWEVRGVSHEAILSRALLTGDPTMVRASRSRTSTECWR